MDMIRIENGHPILDSKISERFAYFKKTVKEIKDLESALTAQLQTEMEAHGIIGIETDDLLITYVPEYDRERFDSKRLKKDKPDLYDEYVSMTQVRSSLRIKVKGE